MFVPIAAMNLKGYGAKDYIMKVTNRVLLLAELLGIFIILPTCLYLWTPKLILPILWIVALICWGIVRKDKTFDRATLWHASALKHSLKPMLIQFVMISLLLFAIVTFFAPELLFSLVKKNPLLWVLILFLYPVLSVYPQEFLYRTFFFHRYHTIFENRILFITLNALLFGYMHIIFHNWVAVVLTTGGGLLFALIYERTRSTAVVFVAHSLYGWMLFTLGLEEFFDNGTLGTIKGAVL